MFGRKRLRIEAAAEQFAIHLQLEGRPKTTRDNYGYVVRRLAKRFPNMPVHKLKDSELHEYVAELGESVSHNALNIYILELRVFLRFLVDNGYLKENPLEHLRTHREPLPPVTPFTREEVGRLIEATQTPFEEAVLVLLLDSGLRASELCNLELEDIDLRAGELIVRKGKGGKSRRLALNAKPRKALRKYLRGRAQLDGLLWPAQWQRKQLSWMLDKLARRAKVHCVYPHRFRHHWAVELRRAGVDILVIQQLLGHSSIQMTLRYVAYVEGEIAVQVHRRHPIAC